MDVNIDVDEQDVKEADDEQSMETEEAANIRDALLSKSMVIIPAKYPDVTINPEQMTELEGMLIKSIMKIPVGEEAPRFLYRRLEKGYIKLSCIGAFTRGWLLRVVSDWNFLGDRLKVIPYEDVPKEPTFRVWIPFTGMTVDDILTCLKVQNQGLRTEEWRFSGGKDYGSGGNYFFVLDSTTRKMLEQRNFLLHFGLTQVKFNLLANNGPEPSINDSADGENSQGGKPDAANTDSNTNTSIN